MIKKYKAKGVVLGKLWGGGLASYPSYEIEAETKSKLLKIADLGLESGELDSGMGFQYLQGIMLIITKVEVIIVKGKRYSREESEEVFVGDLNKKEKSFLANSYLSL